MKRGKRDAEASETPFELFLASTDIRYTYYKDSAKILGNTFGMAVLQDFEALTPNLLARTVETVEGGGIVVLMLRSMKSLKALFTMTMDVHSRYRTSANSDITARFNERFLLSLASCKSALVVDDELNVLPLSSHSRTLATTSNLNPSTEVVQASQELATMKETLAGSVPNGPLIALAKTLDQANALASFMDAISERTLRSTVTLTAARGRGKSAALGLSMAAAVAYGYSNIFVTSPSPENLNTLFEFVFKGFDALDYQEHMDYSLVTSTRPGMSKVIIRVNIFRAHRQTIQYIDPADAAKLGQAELVVIDEAAAIPLPLVRSLLGPYLVFMASTIQGYEGTGRSLSLKLIDQLRKSQSSSLTGGANSSDTTTSRATVQKGPKVGALSSGGVGGANGKAAAASVNLGGTARVLRQLTLEQPIRYSAGDDVEAWLNKLLCLDATIRPSANPSSPLPDDCELYYVNRDTLFSYHRASEAFLQDMMALYVSSHYKNSPNDLQLMSDAPAHHLFVLLGPVNESSKSLPEILCVLQVCLEGQINAAAVKHALARGQRSAGDLIPWLMSQQFQDNDFPALSGARVVRIATHPSHAGKGYGSAAIRQLRDYYSGNLTGLDGDLGAQDLTDVATEALSRKAPVIDQATGSLTTEVLKPRKDLPPLLMKLPERRPESLHWLGVSYGLTEPLFKFWRRGGFVPTYLRLTSNDLTGEHSCVMLQRLKSDAGSTSASWLTDFEADFGSRFISLLSYEFTSLPPQLALRVVMSARVGGRPPLNAAMVDRLFGPYDLKRLDAYARSMVDYHLILDLIPLLARLYFQGRFGETTIAPLQAVILLSIGLQRKSVEQVQEVMNLPASQTLALFNKVMRKLVNHLKSVLEADVASGMADAGDAQAAGASMRALGGDMEAELETAGAASTALLERGISDSADRPEDMSTGVIDGQSYAEYTVMGSDSQWKKALPSSNARPLTSVSLKVDPSVMKAKKRRTFSEALDAPPIAARERAAAARETHHGKKGGKGGKSPGRRHKKAKS